MNPELLFNTLIQAFPNVKLHAIEISDVTLKTFSKGRHERNWKSQKLSANLDVPLCELSIFSEVFKNQHFDIIGGFEKDEMHNQIRDLLAGKVFLTITYNQTVE